MGRTSVISMSLDERIRQNWIQELKNFGVTEGSGNEPLQAMSNAELRKLVVREHLKRD